MDGKLTRKLVSVVAACALSLTTMVLSQQRWSGADTAAAAASPIDETKVPHYFGPYPNWANSPQVLADAIVTIGLGTPTPVSFGNPLVARANATDYATAPGVLGPVFVVLPTAVLPAGTLQSFQTWNQANAGSSPTPSAGGLFHAYVLRPTGTASQYTVVYDSGQLTVPALADPAVSEVATFPVSPAVDVQAGDVVGFYGQGIPVDTGITVNPDLFSYPASSDATLATNVAPALADTLTLGSDPGFPVYSVQDRAVLVLGQRHADDRRSRHRRRGDGHGRSQDGRNLGDQRHQPGCRLRRASDRHDHVARRHSDLARQRECGDRHRCGHQHRGERDRVRLHGPISHLQRWQPDPRLRCDGRRQRWRRQRRADQWWSRVHDPADRRVRSAEPSRWCAGDRLGNDGRQRRRHIDRRRQPGFRVHDGSHRDDLGWHLEDSAGHVRHSGGNDRHRSDRHHLGWPGL